MLARPRSVADSETKSMFSANFARYQPQYADHFYETPYDISKQLFWTDAEGRTFPMYPSDPAIHKEVIKHYVSAHGIPKESMLEFWMEFVDCLLRCHRFEEEAPAEFRAWAYGRLCRYALLARTKKSSS